MTMHAPELAPSFRTLTGSEIRDEVAALETRHGTFDALLDKASRDDLTAAERAAFRRLRGLRFLLGL